MSVEIEDTSGKKQSVTEYAIGKLATHLEIGFSLTQLCEVLTGTKDGDRLAPIHAAARMMSSVAAVAAAMASMGKLERPRHSIIEHVQKLDPEAAELNSHLREKKKILAEHKEHAQTLQKMTERLEALSRLTPEERASAPTTQMFEELDQEMIWLEQQSGTGPSDG